MAKSDMTRHQKYAQSGKASGYKVGGPSLPSKLIGNTPKGNGTTSQHPYKGKKK